MRRPIPLETAKNRNNGQNRFTRRLGLGKNAVNDGKGCISGRKLSAYHPKMGRWTGLSEHVRLAHTHDLLLSCFKNNSCHLPDENVAT